MGTVKRLGEEVQRGLGEHHPKLRKTAVRKLSLAVGAMIEGQTPNSKACVFSPGRCFT
jgi:hypothetical protein